MTFRAPKQATSGLSAKSGFQKAEPMADGQRPLSERELAPVFASFFQGRAADMISRFMDARASLIREYGAYAEIVERSGGGLKFSARLEFLTDDRALDSDLNQKVAGMGFDLRLHSVPITEGSYDERYERRVRMDGGGKRVEFTEQRMLRTYIITAGGAASSVDRAVKSAEDLLHLASCLRPAGIREDLPSNVVPLETARASKPPPKPDSAEPLAEGPAQLQGGRAS